MARCHHFTRYTWALWSLLEWTDGVLFHQNGSNYLHRTVIHRSTIGNVLSRLHDKQSHLEQNKMWDTVWCHFGGLTWDEMQWISARLTSTTNNWKIRICHSHISATSEVRASKWDRPSWPMTETIAFWMVDHFTKWNKVTHIPKGWPWMVPKIIFIQWIPRCSVNYQPHWIQGSVFDNALLNEMRRIPNI